MAIPDSNGPLAGVAEEQKAVKGHVLVVPYPAQGHINPMMHLSNNLAAHGVLITFVNTQFNHERILRSRRSSSPPNQTGPQGNIRLVGIPDGLGYDEYVANFSIEKQAQAIIDLEPTLVKLVEEIQPPVTCIIADLFFISTPAVARHFDLPHVAFWTQTAASYASHLFFTQNHASLKDYLEKLQSEGKMYEKVISCVPSCPTISYKELIPYLQPCNPSDFLFSCAIKCFQNAPNNTFVLMNTFAMLEEESLAFIHAANIHCIGPVLPSQFVLNNNASSLFDPTRNIPTLGTSFWVEDNEGCLPWLNQQEPSSVLYVSFGSITLTSAQQIKEFAAGLEASGCSFLMVVRPEMMEGGGSVTFPDGYVSKMRDSGRAAFVTWAPQLEVLAHPSIGGIFTHAGWNTTLESICRGVPMLCWPYFADQMLNARCIVDTWKIGLDFTVEKVMDNEERRSSNYGSNDDVNSARNKNGTSDEKVALVKSEEIEKKVRQLMDPLTSTEIRKRVSTLSLAAKRAFEGSARSSFKSLLNVIST